MNGIYTEKGRIGKANDRGFEKGREKEKRKLTIPGC
jgi:hypothetical protein